MKIEQQQNTIQGNMTGETIAMGIRTEDMGNVMGLLTDLYKNRLLAVIREYSTNALDAHIEAGVSLPIEIVLPSAFSPFLKIRDYGVGLDSQGIREVYSQYGRSTKRDTNDQVGMLGLGCKSALTYTQQFTVISVKDGQRVTVVVSRDEEGAGHMQIIADEPTTDANGTEVTVAINREDVNRAGDEARTFFAYWAKGTVTVDGQEPKRFDDDPNVLKLSDALYMLKGVQGEDKVVMGNVAYPHLLTSADRQMYSHRYSVIAYVPIGSVKPIPSREALMDTKLTNVTITKIKMGVGGVIDRAIQRHIDSAATAAEALGAMVAWAGYATGSRAYRYKGQTLPMTYEAVTGELLTSSASSHRKGEAYTRTAVKAADWPMAVWVTGFKPEKFNASHKNKLVRWAEGRGLAKYNMYSGEARANMYNQFVMLREDSFSSPFVDPKRVVSWETVRAIRLDPPKTRESGYTTTRVAGSFDIYTENGYESEVLASTFRPVNEAPIFWIRGNEFKVSVSGRALPAGLKKFTLVCLSANRVNKFCREMPEAKPVSEGIEQAHKTWKASLTPDQIKAMAIRDWQGLSPARRLDPSKVNDPAIREAIRLSKIDVDTALQQRRTLAFARHVAEDKGAKPPEDPMTRYALISRWDTSNEAHVYLYLNAAYAAFKKGNL